jgi:hypothetical protein
MANLTENLRAVLIADAGVSAITTSVHVNNVPDSKSKPYVWLQLIDQDHELNLSEAAGTITTNFVCEATSISLATTKNLADAIKTALHAKTGSFGDQNIAFAHITSKDDNYESRQDFGDSQNLHVTGLDIEIGVDSR